MNTRRVQWYYKHLFITGLQPYLIHIRWLHAPVFDNPGHSWIKVDIAAGKEQYIIAYRCTYVHIKYFKICTTFKDMHL